ncbi:MAG: flavin-containing monooxygenase [Dehalococcoidia bacterium]
MTQLSKTSSRGADPAPTEEVEALIIGAGVSGLYLLHCLLQRGVRARIYEAGDGVGGTWYWNHYPGAVLDSESWAYAYSFSRELVEEWNWSAEFASAAEIERYLNYVTDRFDLRSHITLGARVRSAVFDESSNRWDVETEDGRHVRTQFLIAAVGFLSATHLPDLPGIDTFQGESFHTARWPRQPIDFSGKRVGVIGTGSTGVQITPIVAKECAHLSVFQRTPNYCLPLRNAPIDATRMAQIRAEHDEMMARCGRTLTGFPHEPYPKKTFEVTPEEREQFYEKLWAEPGFKKWFSNFKDLMGNREANELFCEFVRRKIRERIHDPAVADKLCPTYHFGAKRPPMETGYYETFNRPNVSLIDVGSDPIERITPSGVKTRDAHYDLDVIIYATGFDAVVGEFARMDIRGTGGRSLKDDWVQNPMTYLCVQTAGFPNLFFGSGTVFSNFPRTAEVVGNFVSGCVAYMKKNRFERIDVSEQVQQEWCDHSSELAKKMLRSDVSSWFFGSNIPGRQDMFLFYAGGLRMYREKCAEVAAKNYQGFRLT